MIKQRLTIIWHLLTRKNFIFFSLKRGKKDDWLSTAFDVNMPIETWNGYVNKIAQILIQIDAEMKEADKREKEKKDEKQ